MSENWIEQDAYITPLGERFPLTHSMRDKLLTDNEGIPSGMIEFATRRGPLQDGFTVIAMQIKERGLQLVLSLQADCREKYWIERARILDAFRPNRYAGSPYARPQSGTFRRVIPGRILRDLFVFVQSVDFSPIPVDQQGKPWQVTATIDLLAADPFWYGPEVQEDCTSIALTGLRFPVGFAPVPVAMNRWVFTGYAATCNFAMTNPGTRHAFPIITIVGPTTLVTIDNTTTGESVSVIDPIPAGTVVTVDLRYGEKRAYDAAGNYYDLDGAVGEFHIACHPEATNGVNNLSVTIAGGPAPAVTIISFRPPYLGI